MKKALLVGGMLGVASLGFTQNPVLGKPETRNRAEIPARYKWDFSPIYANWEAWEAGVREMEAKMDAFPALKGTLASGPQAVLKAYRAYDEIGILQFKVYRYPQLQRDVDTRNQEVAARFQRVTAIFAKFGTATSWFTPELLRIPQATMEQWIRDTPALAIYRFPIMENYRLQAHVLDEKGEKLLSYAAQFNATPAHAFQELSTSDIKFPSVKFADGKEMTLTPGVYQSVLQTNYNQSDRAKAFDAVIRTYIANENTYGAIYGSVLQRDWFTAQARNYPSTLEAALDNDAVPPAVVENLISTVRAGTAPLQRFVRLRKKLLGLETYHFYDSSIPVYKTDKIYPYDESKDVVIASVAPLGQDYVEKYRKFVSGGRIDVY